MNYGLVFILYIMSLGQILNQHTSNAKVILRSIEKSAKKLINAKHAVIFNQQCIKLNLLPNFTNIYIRVSHKKHFF